ncbi:chemotaxis protein CheD [Methyloversatilis thermotolerans]|uniref:chemotaxis protein CheD n=1 Tax=Methyloversatilis thermotolerans TaxID=1346290 RepID=UPI0003624AF4|nr:chemotaxis protein CheD [Methyloversatilis thermotolerans]
MCMRPPALTDIYLKPGDLFFGDGMMRLRTVLGSCVAITMWHPKRLIGGMCHFMLPGASRNADKDGLSARYADDALKAMIRGARSFGTDEHDYQFKLFGGGNMFPHVPGSRQKPVGEANVKHARKLLASLGVQPLAEHTGGFGQRVLVMEVWSGVVWVRHDDTRAEKKTDARGELPC